MNIKALKLDTARFISITLITGERMYKCGIKAIEDDHIVVITKESGSHISVEHFIANEAIAMISRDRPSSY